MTPLITIARVHGRQVETGSLCLPWRGLLRQIVAVSQGTRLGPLVTPQTFEFRGSGQASTVASAQAEYDDGRTFFERHFAIRDPKQVLKGRDALDLGCGYGGRTVWYSEYGRTRYIAGVEIDERMVDRCRAFAAHRESVGVEFHLGLAEALPYPDESFDVVLSYDVIEHVDDPCRAFDELARVLRPGGEAWLVFPTYFGARVSHLDYLTQVPAIHRVFDPSTTVDVVNEFLTGPGGHRFGTQPQPRPALSPIGRRTLPSLNGLRRTEARAMAARSGLEVVSFRQRPFVEAHTPLPFAGPVCAALTAIQQRRDLPELFISSLSLHLHRPTQGTTVSTAPSH
jgi:ubiquinone/menaquinone biosynthesis C-methylase UbiE